MSAVWTIVDLSHPLGPETPPFPGDPPVEIEVVDSISSAPKDGRRHLNCSRFAASIHCGTHMDAPFHFFANGTTIDGVDLSVCVGPAVLARHADWGARASIEPPHLEPHRAQIEDAGRVVLNTGWYRRFGRPDYFADHPVLSGATAQWLVNRGVRLVGVDFPSVDHPPFPAHDVLLGNGVVIVENLTNLDAIPDALFELCALPLAIKGRDGSPVRCIARPLASHEVEDVRRT